MHDAEREAMRAFLTAEATRRYGAERAAALGRDIETLAADLASVQTAEVPDDVEPAFFLLEGSAE
jgi:hypothetical protein